MSSVVYVSTSVNLGQLQQDMDVIHRVKVRYVRTVRTVSEQAVTGMNMVHTENTINLK